MAFIEFHILYAALWIPLILSLFFFKSDADEFRKMKKGAQIYYKLLPYLCVLLVYLYPFMNAKLLTDSQVAYVTRLGFLLIGATSVNVLALLFRKDRNLIITAGIPTMIGYLVLMVGWNIFMHCRTLAFIVNMVLAVVAIFPLYLIAILLGGMAVTYTKEEQAQAARNKERSEELKAQWAAERRAREEQDRKREAERIAREQKMVDEWVAREKAKGKNIRRPGDAWQPPTATSWENNDISWENNDNSSNRKQKSWTDTVAEWYEEKRSVTNVSGTGTSRCCANCGDFRNGECHNSNSSGRTEVIWYPDSHCCGYHHY